MHIVMDLSLITQEKLYIQTRHADQNIVSILQNKRLKDFFEYDYEERKSWEYPPFSTIIKMTYDGPRSESITVQNYLEKQFGMYELHVYHSKSGQPENLTTHAVLKISNTLWPLPNKTKADSEETANFRRKLQIFPQSWTIIVNPHNIL
jgi:primosomal protein N'